MQTATETESEKAGKRIPYAAWTERHAPDVLFRRMGEHHLRCWDWFDSLKPGVRPDPLVECWPRGDGKSTTVKLGLTFAGTTERRKFVLYVCATQDAANTHISSISNRLERMGVDRETNKYGFSRGWRGDMVRTDIGFKVLAFGLDGAARGVQLDFGRPDIIVLDDVDALGDSAKAVQKKLETISQSLFLAGTEDVAIIFIQNKIHANSVMARLLKGNADILRTRRKSPIIAAINGFKWEETFDAENDRNVYRITAGEPSWPDRSIASMERDLNDIGLAAFLREMQQEVGSGGLLHPKFQPQRNAEDWHVCAPFTIPRHWKIWGSHDHGTNAPCAFYVYASGDDGTVYVVDEIYEPGLSSRQQSQLALERMESRGFAERRVYRTPDGNDRYTGTFRDGYFLAFDSAHFPPKDPDQRIGEYPVEDWWNDGWPAIPAVKARKAGWSRINEYLMRVVTVRPDPKKGEDFEPYERPAFRIFKGRCPNLVAFLSNATSDPDDADELDPTWTEDHAGDSLRYGILTSPEPSGDDPDQQRKPDELELEMMRARQSSRRR